MQTTLQEDEEDTDEDFELSNLAGIFYDEDSSDSL